MSTAIGVEGIGVEDGRDYLNAEQPDEFASAIFRLLADPVLRKRLAANARQTVARYDWAVIGARLLSVYDSLESASVRG